MSLRRFTCYDGAKFDGCYYSQRKMTPKKSVSESNNTNTVLRIYFFEYNFIDMNNYDLIIIGGGPAGLTAAVYALRGGLSVLIVEHEASGGQMLKTHKIENYPGFESVAGYELATSMLRQTESLGCEFKYDEVKSVQLNGKIKKIEFSNGDELETENIIIATGARPKTLNVAGEKEFTGRGVSYCATCDGNFYKGKKVVVAGGGNTAVYDAVFLSNIAAKVYLVHRRRELRADKVLVESLKLKENVVFLFDSVIERIIGNDKLNSVSVKNVLNNRIKVLSVDGIFIAIGQSPQSELFASVNKDDYGYIITDSDMKTNSDGVYAIGDVRAKSLRQIVTACADGAIAASAIIRNRI